MTNATRTKRSAQAMAKHLHDAVQLSGWIIVASPGTWYGPYATQDQARSRIGAYDSLDMRIAGTVVEAAS